MDLQSSMNFSDAVGKYNFLAKYLYVKNYINHH